MTSNVTGTSGEVQIPIECGGAAVLPGDIIFGDADGVIIVPQDYMPLLEIAEKKAADEAKKREAIANGLVYNKRADFDVVKFFEKGAKGALSDLKKECHY